MTFDDAVSMLRSAGLIVQVGEAQLVTAADPQAPPVRAHGVEAVYRFGFSIRQVDGAWFLRGSPPDPVEEFSDLDSAVARGLSLFHDYREIFSADVYGDQFARFDATAPCEALDKALQGAGWLAADESLQALGLQYLSGARFSVAFSEKRRCVLVSVNPPSAGLWQLVGPKPIGNWRLTVRCYRQARVPGTSRTVPSRGHRQDGTPLEDTMAPQLSYDVAIVLNRALMSFATNIRWAVNHDPDHGTHSSEPIDPARPTPV